MFVGPLVECPAAQLLSADHGNTLRWGSALMTSTNPNAETKLIS
jgi:hypothetical protein